jgi:hypothetical protein
MAVGVDRAGARKPLDFVWYQMLGLIHLSAIPAELPNHILLV